MDKDPYPLPEEKQDLESGNYPKENDVFGPSPTQASARYSPRIQVTAHSAHQGHAVAAKLLQTNTGMGINQDPVTDSRWTPAGTREYRIRLVSFTPDGRPDPTALGEILEERQINLEITGATPTFLYGVGPKAVSLVVPGGTPDAPDFSRPLIEVTSDPTVSIEPPDRKGAAEGQASVPPGNRFGGRRGRTGIQVLGRGPDQGTGAVAVYRFAEVSDPEIINGNVRFQLKVGIDRGGELELTSNRLSTASLVVRNRKTGFTSAPVEFEPQTGRLLDEWVPAEAIAGGDFDVLIRGLTPGQQLALHGMTATVPSASLVTATHPFALNLLMSLVVLWLVSILVVAIAVFCSTFLSWPIAVVLTLLLLLGRWGVDTLGDALAPGSSRGIAQDLFKIRDPTQNKAVTDSMEALATTLRAVGPILPDVSKFPVFEDIDRGVSIPPAKVGRAARELFVYGIPLVLLTYVILRRKEVAP